MDTWERCRSSRLTLGKKANKPVIKFYTTPPTMNTSGFLFLISTQSVFLSLIVSALTETTPFCVTVLLLYCPVSDSPPPPLQTVQRQWSLCAADIEQSLWTVIVLKAEPSLGDRAGRHRYGFLHLMSRPLAHKCLSFNELWPCRQRVLSIIWLLMPIKY